MTLACSIIHMGDFGLKYQGLMHCQCESVVVEWIVHDCRQIHLVSQSVGEILLQLILGSFHCM